MARVMGIVTSAAGSCHQPFPRARQPPPRRVRGHPNIPRRVPVAAPSAFSRTRGLREERGAGCRAGGLGRRTRPQPAPQPRVRREGPREPTSRHASADRGPNVSRRPHARVRPAAEAWCPEPPPPSPSPHISVPPRWREDTWQRDIPPPKQTNKLMAFTTPDTQRGQRRRSAAVPGSGTTRRFPGSADWCVQTGLGVEAGT